MTERQSRRSSPVVGIDLGTTMSAIGIFRDGKVELFENGLGETLTPSAVAHDPKTGRMVVGQTAKEIVAVHPEQGVTNFKRAMGSEQSFSVGGREYSPLELSAYWSCPASVDI